MLGGQVWDVFLVSYGMCSGDQGLRDCVGCPLETLIVTLSFAAHAPHLEPDIKPSRISSTSPLTRSIPLSALLTLKVTLITTCQTILYSPHHPHHHHHRQHRPLLHVHHKGARDVVSDVAIC